MDSLNADNKVRKQKRKSCNPRQGGKATENFFAQHDNAHEDAGQVTEQESHKGTRRMTFAEGMVWVVRELEKMVRLIAVDF
jgi:hypothetical protein